MEDIEQEGDFLLHDTIPSCIMRRYQNIYISQISFGLAEHNLSIQP
jgi:hypothetical protein